MLNPLLKGAKRRALREHGAGRRVGRTAWSPARAQEQRGGLPASPQGDGAAGSHSALTVRVAALPGSPASPSPRAPSAQAAEAAVRVSVREAEEMEGEGGAQSNDAEQGGAQRGAPPAAVPLRFSPPAALAVRSPLGRAPGAGVPAVRTP